MNKYIKGIIIGVVAGLAIILITTTKISINIDTHANSANAQSTNNMTIDTADFYLNRAVNEDKFASQQGPDAQVAQAIYEKKIYELLKEKLK
jgi:hypothetical protein